MLTSTTFRGQGHDAAHGRHDRDITSLRVGCAGALDNAGAFCAGTLKFQNAGESAGTLLKTRQL